MRKKVLAILGASYLQEPLYIKARNKGLYTLGFSWPEGAVCKDLADEFYPISVLDYEDILKVCEEKHIDGIVTVATDICIPVIAKIAEKLQLPGNSVDTALSTTNKFMMREKLQKSDIKIPAFITTNKLIPFSETSLRLPVIVKPVDRSGSLGVTRVNTTAEFTQALEQAIACSLSGKIIIEEFIEGDEVSVEAISYKGRHKVITITDKVTTGPPHFVELEHHQPSILPDSIQKEIYSVTEAILELFNVQNGASHTELKITQAGEIYCIEIGTRMGGDFIGSDLVELSTGFDFVNAVIDIALGQFNPVEDFEVKSSSGVYFLSKETEYLQDFMKQSNDDRIVKKKIQSEVLKPLNSSNDRSGYLIYKSPQRLRL